MIIAVLSEDVKFCNDLAIMCSDNEFQIKFIEDNHDIDSDINCIVLDLDQSAKLLMDKCREYSRESYLIFGAMSVPTKSEILTAKDAGCLMVLTKSNFTANLVDIIHKSKAR